MEQKASSDSTLPIITIVGPTASGKTRRAVTLAKEFNAEIISGDSRQVYRRMDIGTGKDLNEYQGVPYHLIDICEPGYKYNLHEFLRDFDQAETAIRQRGKNIVFCGGTGLYVESALSGITLPEVPANNLLREQLKGKSLEELTLVLSSFKKLHNTTDIDSCARAIRAIEIEHYYQANPDIKQKADRKQTNPRQSLILLIDIDRDERRKRISDRLSNRLLEGMVQEVKSLINEGIKPEDLEYYGLEYKFVTQFITGKISEAAMVHDLEIAIHQFAKRQMTWFRGMERRGFTLHRIKWDMPDAEFVKIVNQLLNECG